MSDDIVGALRRGADNCELAIRGTGLTSTGIREARADAKALRGLASGPIPLVLAEMARQDEKWGAQRKHHPLYWLAILVEEVGELSQTIIGPDVPQMTPEAERELTQVAAVAVQWLAALHGEGESDGT